VQLGGPLRRGEEPFPDLDLSHDANLSRSVSLAVDRQPPGPGQAAGAAGAVI
jgi:hypothetical protein